MRLRSPLKSEVHRSAFARGIVGAAICASVFAVVALLVPVVSRWLDDPQPAETPSAIANIPDDTGPALGPNVVRTEHKARKHAKAKPAKHAVLVGGNVVILDGPDVAPAATPATSDPAPATSKTPVTKPKTPKKAPKVVTDESKPVAAPIAAPAAATAPASSGLVRLSVQSVGIGPNANGDPELQAKLAIQGAQASDALPPTVTLHLRPTIPASLQSTDGLAMKASVDMVNAQRTTASDPALQMRVRMTIAAAQASSAAAVPAAQAPAPPDAKSNVIALTAPLKAFVRTPEGGTPGDGDPTTPPGNEGPGDGGPTTPPYEGPADPTTPPDQPVPGDPTTPPTDQGPGNPTTPDQPTPGDPTTPPTDPGPADPTTPPGQPTGGDPTTPPTTPPTTGQPPAGDPTAIPPTEILIPVGPVRPNGGTTTVPVPTDPAGGTPTTDQVPVVVIVEELPPEDPPADPADPSTPVVQDPAPEVVTPPVDSADPGTTPTPDNPGYGDATAVVVSSDAPAPASNNS